MTTMGQVSSARDRILRAATALFAAQGYYRTGTRDIARVADVSEVTLFRCFESKEALFLSSLRATYSAVEKLLKPLHQADDTQRTDQLVPKIIAALFDMVSVSPEIVRLSAVALFEMRGEAREECYAQLGPLIQAVHSLVASNMKIGAIRQLNPAIATAGMALTVIAHTGFYDCIQGRESSHPGRRELVDEYSTFWATVLLPPTVQLRGYDDPAAQTLQELPGRRSRRPSGNKGPDSKYPKARKLQITEAQTRVEKSEPDIFQNQHSSALSG